MRRKNPKRAKRTRDFTPEDPGYFAQENRVVGNNNEGRVADILSRSLNVETASELQTKASGAVRGDQDLFVNAADNKWRISCKHKQQSENGRIPTLPFKEVCEPVKYTRKSATGEIPVTVVTWESNEGQKSDFALIPLETFINLLERLNDV